MLPSGLKSHDSRSGRTGDVELGPSTVSGLKNAP